MKMKKILAFFLALSLFASAFPLTAFAEETEGDAGTALSGKLFLDKEATLTDDGTYTIDLSAYATGTPVVTNITEGVPLDVVLVLDQSASLVGYDKLTALKSSVETFINELQTNGAAYGIRHRVSIAGFASNALDGSSSTIQNKVSYASDPEEEDGTKYYGNDWVNTGLFVNGVFKKYGKVEYTPVTEQSQVNTTQCFVYDWDPDGDGIYERYRIYCYNKKWQDAVQFLNSDGSLGSKNVNLISSDEVFFNTFKGKLYTMGESTSLLTDRDYEDAWEYLTDGANGSGELNADIAKAMSRISANGATRTFYGMQMASELIKHVPKPDDDVERKKIVVVFTDGRPAFSGYDLGEANAALSEAKKIKEAGTEIYTIGLFGSQSVATSVDTFMNQLSSNYSSHTFTVATDKTVASDITYTDPRPGSYTSLSPYFYKDGDNYWPVEGDKNSSTISYYIMTNEGKVKLTNTSTTVYQINSTKNADPGANYYRYTTNKDDLEGMFQNIVKEATTPVIRKELTADMTLKDVMADGFKLTNTSKITVSVVPGSVSDANSNILPDELTNDKITWDEEAQQVLSFTYAQKEATGTVVLEGAAGQSEMTLTAKVTEDGIITVSGFDYVNQYIQADHPGSKLVVSITGVEVDKDTATDSLVTTNKGTSGIYEGPESDLNEDGQTGGMLVPFPVPTTYLTAKTYYVDYSGELVIDPKDFHMNIEGISADIDGYNYFNTNTPGTTLELEHGTVTVQEDGKWLFTMDPGDWSITDSFFLFGTTNDPTVTGATANKEGNMWSKITIITPEDISGKLFLDKEATLTDDGTYTIDLNAYATGTPAITNLTEGVPLDVVLVIDQSGSLMLNGMLDDLQASVSAFVNELKINGEAYGVSHRVSVATYASAGTDGATGFLGDGFPRSESPEEGTNRLYPHWYNTGLFVNGKFKNYGTLEYIPVESVEAMGKQVRFLLDYDYEGDGIWERWVTDTASFWRFRTYRLNPIGYKNTPITDANGKNITTNQALFDNYKLYTAGAATCTLTDDDYKEAWEYLAVGENGSGALNEDISRIIGQIASSGGTRTSYGMKMAAQLIKNCPDDGIERKKIVIVFSDGEPGQNTYNDGDAQAALAEAAKIKDSDIEIYTIGLYKSSISANAKTFMDRLSSNYSDHTFSTKTTTLSTSGYTFYDTMGNAKLVMSKCFYKDEAGNYWPVAMSYPYDNTGMKRFYYITDEGEVTLQNSKTTTYPGLYTLNHVKSDDPDANYFRYTTDPTKLEGMFKDIVKEATTVVTEARLDANMIMKDVLADDFKLTDNTTITVSVVPGSVSEKNSNIPADELTADKITWGEAQQVLTFAYPAEFEKSGSVVVNGAADQTEMTLTAKASENGIITVTGFNYADPQDPFNINAQYIQAGHPGSKLVVTITGVEAQTSVVTDSTTTTNKGTSGIYEAADSDMDEDGDPGEILASFPVPTTYLTSEYYYLDENNSVTFHPKDFLMTIKGVNVDSDGYNFFGEPGTTVETEHGTIIVNTDGTVTYTLTDTQWDGEDIFYLFGTTKDTTVTGATANKNGNMWSKITILTAKDATGKLHVDKNATLEDNGTYTIDLEAFATGSPAITSTAEAKLNAAAIMKDVMADGFVMTAKTTITVSVVPGSVGEDYKDVAATDLTEDMITWGNPQQVLTFAYPAKKTGTGKVVVTGAADKTQMSITANATTAGVITVTGFNYANPTDNHKENAQYISYGHPGSKLVLTITGVEAKSDIVTDSITTTNKGTSGIYEAANTDLDGDGVPGGILATFPVPTTYLTSEVYVVDYAKTLTVDPADFQMDISAISVDADGYNYFNPATTVVTDAYGKVTVSDGKVTYTPSKTNWKGFDTFHVFGTTSDETVKAATANGNGNMWAKVSVIPANNVYYEDTFVTSEDTDIVGIVYSGVWDEVDKDGNANAGGNGQGENAESGETADDVNQGGVHGWEDTLADDKDFSDGSAHVSTTPGATATFTFTGTGVDIYSRTNMETGMVMAMLYEGESTTGADGKNLVAKYGLMVDNLAASGDYYQIPTLSLCQIPAKDENGNTVMKDLPYGTYTVMLIVSKASASQTGEERFTYYLDGIRVYNPIQELEDDKTVSDAYGDKELNAKFVEIRDKLLDANSFSAEDGYSTGPVFIDRITSTDGEHTDNTESWEVGDYRVFGPENEVYLSAGQIIAFAVEYSEDAHYYIGMKSLTGEYADVWISDPDGMMAIIPVEHTTDMYYELSPAWEDWDGNPYMDAEGNRIGIITVEADWFNGDYAMDENWEYILDEYGNRTDYVGAILALTKLKVTGPKADTFKFARVSSTKLLSRVQEIANTLPDVENPDSDTQIKPEKLLGMVDKWNIALQEDFEVKFYLQINEDIEDSAKVSLSIGNGNITYDVSALEKTEDGYYLLKARVAAKQMNDKISVQIIHGEDKGEVFTYTVREYCDTILSKDEYSAYHALVKEMLNYGAMAQMYFNYDIQNLANAGITGAASVAVPETAKDMALSDKLSAVDFYGASLVYRDKIAVRYYFTGDVTGLTFTANGKTYTPVAKDGMHYIEIADILPQNLDQQITLTVVDANGNILSVTYGPMNYIVRMNVRGSDALKNLMKALYNYHLAAKAWYQQ